MKKSTEKKITPEEILQDFNKIMSFISKIDNKDLTKINLEELSNKSEKIKKEVEDKYNPYIKEIKKNLDSTK
tara:strand:- start:263 stop:478 length:216 start_codon:yes stop_codon:yes gene_type:complete